VRKIASPPTARHDRPAHLRLVRERDRHLHPPR
jgi:hypothetical protein